VKIAIIILKVFIRTGVDVRFVRCLLLGIIVKVVLDVVNALLVKRIF
jgi:hypothetical protein